MATDKDLMLSLLDKIYAVVVGTDDINGIDANRGAIASFTLPGIPIEKEDLDFSFIDLAKMDVAADFSSLVNSVPPNSGRWQPSNRKVESYYSRVLNESIRPVVELSDDEKKRLLVAQQSLTRLVDAIDLTTGGTKQVPADTPLYEAYQDRQQDYLNALMSYKSLQADFLQRPTDLSAQAKWFSQGPVLKKQVEAKYKRWIAGGKIQIEAAINTIEELGRGTGERWSHMLEMLRAGVQQTSEGQEFYFTKYFPSAFWDEAHASSWTKFSMSHEELHTVDESSTTNYGGGGGTSFGMWSLSASASYAEQKQHFKSDGQLSTFDVELIRVPIRRSWWDPTVFWDRGWKFDPQISNLVLSEGTMPPKGEMGMYPTALIVARNLKVGIDLTSEENSHVATQMSASGSVGWGPFSVKGNYSRSTDRKTHDFVRTAAGIECAGMQIIGFVCEPLPKSPNPDLTLNWKA
ncbi:hypothetical protein [Burkholderia sp. LMU1-1-1.1]|uniref:hypothetical protein n=1 Tax=Burkholderia sp. LMU1-1-1.1 TaxID=3135266 RepID=UPI003434EA85